jgi:hypothetical protein
MAVGAGRVDDTAGSSHAELELVLAEFGRFTDVVCGQVDTVADDQVVGLLDGVTAAVARLQGARSVLIGRVAASGLHRDDGASTVAGWLADRYGSGRKAAGAEARQATTLGTAPVLADAVKTGQVCPEAAGLIGDVLRRRSVPGDLGDVERRLVAAAGEQGADGVRSEIGRMRGDLSQESLAERERRIRQARFASMRQCRDGSWDLRAKLPADEGALVDSALRRSMPAPGGHDPDCRVCGGDPDGQPECSKDTYAQRLADGLVALAGHGFQCERAEAGRRRGPVTGVSVIVDEKERQAWIGAEQISEAMAARLACDSSLTRIVLRSGSQPVDIGRASRSWTDPQRRALEARDGGCRGPGCDRPASWCDAHHIRWWRHQGRTAVDNGILLCHACHHLVHDDGWTVQLIGATGEAVWRRPDGTVARSTHPRRIAA